MISGGIFGPKLSGKTTLAKHLSLQYFQRYQQKTLCLDINGDQWGPHVRVTDNEETFWKEVWDTKEQLVLVDEASSTIQRDKTLIPAFTRLRHLRHRLVVIGHSGTDLLPAMRNQLDVLYLFRQPRQAAEVWAYTFADERILAASELQQYEFLFCRLYETPVKHKLPKP
jgi:hypothetical protein